MQRLLQLGFLLLTLATIVTPLAEYFDRWDSPGLGSDTEFALFLFIFFLCLVLVVALLVARDALKLRSVSSRILLAEALLYQSSFSVLPPPVPPHTSPPLQI